MSKSDTIAALATAPAPSGVAVIRVSGTRARRALRSIFSSKRSPVKHPRELIFGKLIDFKSKQEIDAGLAVYMPAPFSYTGEDVVEFQMHGSLLLVQRILRSLFAFGVVPAEPGEFTQRAFLNGKLDLTQAEAISDLISSTSEIALKIATEQMKGRLSSTLAEIGEPLRNTLAEVEAAIDFPEEDIKPETIETLSATIHTCREKIEELASTYSFGHVVKEGFRVLLCGLPNAGKSSLLNALLGTERAIVTEIPGTTRDLIEADAIYSGFRFIFCDSAGITESADQVEQIGIELAKERLGWADLILLVIDANVRDSENERWQALLKLAKNASAKVWIVVNKIDIAPDAFARLAAEASTADRMLYISARTKEGLDYLTEGLVEEVKGRLPDRAESSVTVTSERHRECLRSSSAALERCVQAIESKMPIEFVSAELRSALTALDEIVGKTWSEDILGRIFSRFCIGK